MGGIGTLTFPWQTQGKWLGCREKGGEGGTSRRRFGVVEPRLSAEVTHPSHFLFIIFHLTLCKLSGQDISSLFFTFSPSIFFCLRLFKFLSTVDGFVRIGGGGAAGGAWGQLMFSSGCSWRGSSSLILGLSSIGPLWRPH